jgi:hypothetical protein
MDNNYETLKKIMGLQNQITELEIYRWLEFQLFTWNWWLLVILFVVPWIILIRLIERKRIIEILLFGTITSHFTIYLDDVGKELMFWVYPIELTPFAHRADPFDVTMLPIAYMLIYQYFKTWKSFSIALINMALFFAFIGEPFAHWTELTYYLKWKYIYSFFFYFLTGILVRWFVVKLLTVTRKGE